MKIFNENNVLAMVCGAVALCVTAPVSAQQFSYDPPGQLVPGSGQGRADQTVYIPGMRYPIEQAPSYPNSQVWGRGGNSGGGGSQCDQENYSYPWHDNFCETRSWDVPMCPGGSGHQGQDIRASTCEKNKHWVVASEAGTVTSIGTYTVTIVTDGDVTKHRYMHMEPSSLQIKVNDKVTRGQRLGRVSNFFGDTPTTIHLHYDLFQTVSGVGPSYVPPYMSLVKSYEELIGMPAEPCGIIPASGGIVDDKDKCFSLGGNTMYWRTLDGAGHEGHLYWTYAFTAAGPSAWAQWNFELVEAGRYRLEVYLTPTEATSQKVRYTVRHDAKTEDVILDLSADNAGWREIGEYQFAQGGGQSLSVYDNTGEARTLELKIPADAARLTRLDGAMPAEDMGTAPQDMGSAPRDMGTTPPRDMGSSAPRDMGTTPSPRQDMSGTSSPDMGGNGATDGEGESTVSTSSCDEGCASAKGGELPVPLEALLLVGGVWGLRQRRRRRD